MKRESERRFQKGLSWVESIVPNLHPCIRVADDNLLLPYITPYLDICEDCRPVYARLHWKGCILLNYLDKVMSDYIKLPILDFTKSEGDSKHNLTPQF